MKGVVEYDRLEREKRFTEHIDVISKPKDQGVGAVVAPAGGKEEEPVSSATVSRDTNIVRGDDGEEYEEVEVTDDESDENPSKRQKTDGSREEPVEFNEDDIAFQLAAMGQDYGLDPGEYGDGQDEDLEEGAEGLALTEADATALFKDMLNDYHINPYTTWEKIIEAGQIVEDDRYTVLSNMKSRKDIWAEWSRERVQLLKGQREREEKKDPRIPYLAFLQKTATPKLYWPEFRRKYKKEPELRNAKLSDKEREKAYRDYINRRRTLDSQAAVAKQIT